jgi:hypothetical protein
VDLADAAFAVDTVDGFDNDGVELTNKIVELLAEIPREIDDAVEDEIPRRTVAGPPVVKGGLVAVCRLFVEEGWVSGNIEMEVPAISLLENAGIRVPGDGKRGRVSIMFLYER